MKLPYLKFYTGDWLKDPQLSLCSPATRGIWIDLVARMHEQNTGKLKGTHEQLSRLSRCSASEMEDAIIELANTNTATIYTEDDELVIECRRLNRQAELSFIRQQAGSKGGAKSQSNREQSPVHESESESSSLERVREFARGEGICESDADWFFFKGQGNGWTNGGEPIRDWKATLRSWNRAGYLPSQKQRNNGQHGLPECLKFSNPRDWQEARRIVRFLDSCKSKHPDFLKQIDERIAGLRSQFNLK